MYTYRYTPILVCLPHLRPAECSFSSHCHQRLARRSYLLHPTKANLLADAKSVIPPAPAFRWSSESGNEVTTTIVKRSIERGGPTAGKIQFADSTQSGSSAASTKSCARRKSSRCTLRDSLNSLIFQNCWGCLLPITLGDHEGYSLASGSKGTVRGFRLQPA